MEDVRLDKIGAEVNSVLQNLPREMFYRIPKKVTSMFEKYKTTKVEIDINESFEKQKISKQAKEIIFCISYNYLLTEEEKQEAIKKMKLNEEKINESYDVFLKREKARLKKSNQEDVSNTTKEANFQSEKKNEQVELVKYNESIFTKIIKEIKEFFGK